jgi:NADH-quinone oxidoreductase subunit L
MHAIIVFGPLLGFLIAGLGRRYIGATAAMGVTTGLVVLSAALSVLTFAQVMNSGEATTITLMRFLDVGDFQANWAIHVDMLTAVMLVVVTSVSALVHIYSIGYMSDDPDRERFFSYLSLFTFAMLMLVTADNFIQLFFGWEGVGLASYLLIGFWYKKDTANAAAIKAFVTNRVGDFGLALGVMAIFYVFGSVEFATVFDALRENALVTPFGASEAVAIQELKLDFLGLSIPAIELMAFLLFIGAMGKSAQFFLHVWLPDAMEGPTPVSALIHAATMVTAGVFLVVRCAPIYEFADWTAAFITVLGAVTALYAATVGVAQNDIKRVIAYSTCSQLGYMFFAAGIGSYGAAMFHLFTHAFFKALLFLCAGAVIHGLHHEQDMRKMGGVWKKMPWTWALMIIGTLALTGIGIPGTQFGFAGFFSKDRIIEDAYLAGAHVGLFAFWMGVIAAALTSFYSWRLIFMTFHGTYRGEQSVLDHAHEAPWVMRGPLVLLSIGAVFAGVLFYSPFVGKTQTPFWQDAIYSVYDTHNDDHGGAYAEAGASVEAASDKKDAAYYRTKYGIAEDASGGPPVYVPHSLPLWVLWIPVVVSGFGFLFAWFFYVLNEGVGARIAARGGPLHSLLYNKWYFDEIYNATFVRATRWLGDVFWKIGDEKIIDGLGPNGIASSTMATGRRSTRIFQSGYLFHYAFAMLVGVAALATFLLLRAQGVF